ncbi:MAG: RecQ family ATP-dependent DNA helicase [Anaerolineales bacterium]|nr:RecQ family ATP-dependent DNA helicase [Anaerolineales bacterium]
MPPDLLSLLRTHFGFSSFRPGQEEAIQNLLAGHHTLAVMPTGAGKSLIFQLAALQLNGLTLVISPLIALMKDQVDSLTKRGIPATFINSALPTVEQNNRLQGLAQGKYQIVYIAPERLRSVPFLHALRSRTVSLLAVDEAHCISEWGHDFRPDYLHIAQARAALGNPLTAALTATATPQVQNDILRLLGLGDSSTRIVTGFNRPNISLNVLSTFKLPAKLRSLNELLSPRESGSVIVYTGTRRDAEEVAEFAREVVKVPAEFYHAGLPAEERTRIQDNFISGKLNLVAATNAFGMGIDRADVRQVIHYSVPGSLEAYYQEAGRAGRDGEPAKVTLFYDPQDRALQEFFIASSVVSPEELQHLYRAMGNVDGEIWMTTDDFSRRTDLHSVKIKVGLAELERVGALEHLGDDGVRMLLRKGKWDLAAIEKAAARSKEHTKHRTDQLNHMINYAETNACRRRVVLKHFGDNASPDALVCCDNCLSQKNLPEAGGDVAQMSHTERAALIILDTVRKLGSRLVGREKLAQILKGSKARDILQFHYDKHVYYAKLAALKQSQIEEMIKQLVSLGYFKIIGGEYPVLSLTPKGESAIKQKASIELKMPRGVSPHSIEKKKAEMQAGGTIGYTVQLIAEGLAPEQIARQRGLTLITIYGHCAKLIEAGKLDVDKVVPKDVKDKIENAIQKVGSTQYLFPIKSLLPDEITYEMIRCVVSAYSLRHSDTLTPATAIPNSSPDAISSYLSSSHPRPLTGNWHTGFALDFHSSYTGADWNRSGVGDLTYRLKYQSDSSALPALIEHTRKLFNAHPEMNQFDIILPVPSSTQRDFNPVHEFCKALSRAFNKPMQTSLAKTRQTKPQKEMHTLPQKRDNVAGAFTLNSDITGKRVLIVDDLFDSGATLEEITRLLSKHKAARVNVLTFTRTIHSDA